MWQAQTTEPLPPFLQQFVDRDPGPGARAFDCGPQSYDGHTGTDIRTADLETMAAGVNVIATADGVVRGIRDGIPDAGTATMPEGQGCGNGVALTRRGVWETQYWHLMQGSITVTAGEQVAAGTPLGRIGLSGRTEFPHLEFILRHEGRVVDPFDADDTASCDAPISPLWSEPVENLGGGILSAGFSHEVPAFEAIRAGTADAEQLDMFGPAIVLWGFIHGGRTGDIVHLRIEDSLGGSFHDQQVVLERTQAELFRATGRRIPGALPPGDYTGTVSLIRDGTALDTRAVTVPVR